MLDPEQKRERFAAHLRQIAEDLAAELIEKNPDKADIYRQRLQAYESWVPTKN